MDRISSLQLSAHCLALLMNADTPYPVRLQAAALLLELPGGFWLRPGQEHEETFKAFLVKVSAAAISSLDRRKRSLLEPEELADEAWIEFIERAPTIRINPRTWLIGLVYRCSRRLVNGTVSLFADELGTVDPVGFRPRLAHEESAVDPRGLKLRQAIAKLKGKQGRAVQLRIDEGLSYREISQTMGISEDAARALISRSLPKLRLLVAASVTRPRRKRRSA